jgi:hypothetical protein
MMTKKQMKEWVRWAFRARWYLEANCSGQDGAEKLMARLDELVEDYGLDEIIKECEPL